MKRDIKKCSINPSVIKYNENEYVLYRRADYPQDTPVSYISSCGIRVDFYRSDASYVLVKNSQQEIDCKFKFKNYSYYTSRMVDLERTRRHKIEDLRFVENCIEERNGSVFCLACCSVFSDIIIYSGEKREDCLWNEKKPLGFSWRSEPGICWVNLNSGEVDFAGTLNKEKLSNPQKNWMIFKNRGRFYCIYSVDPLVYNSSESLRDISFDSIQLSQKPLMHNSTCPIEIGENRYCMLCQERLEDFKSDKKIAWAYNKYFVSFDLIDEKITNITKTLLTDIPLEYYCSSIIKENNKIKVFAGIEDVDHTFFYIDIPAELIKNTNSLSKKYIWCFMGQVHAQGARAKMIDSLKKTGGEYYCNVNSTWQSKDSLVTQDYKKILEQSIFIPCPRGNSSPDTFRLYEAIEAGSIPVVERDEYWENLFGKDHPIIQVSDWNKAANDIIALSKESQWLEEYSIKLSSWWNKHKAEIKTKINDIIKINKKYDISQKNKEKNITIDPHLKTKQQEFINIKNKWADFKDYGFFKHICEKIPQVDMPSDKFSVYNPGKKIAIVSLYTSNIADFAIYSEKSIREYCNIQGYTFYVYREALEGNASANWSKAKAILSHIDDHENIIWMDSDTIIFNPEKKFEDILSRCTSVKKIIACEDIGTNNKSAPKGSMFNSGVVIFQNHGYTKNIIKKWMNFNGDKSSLYASGGDQEVLCDILKKSDGFGFNRKIFPMNEFNTEPRLVNEDTFVLHFMAYPYELKKIFMSYFSS
jgi:hypothetical protein